MTITREDVQNFISGLYRSGLTTAERKAAVVSYLADNGMDNEDIKKVMGDLNTYNFEEE